MNIIRLESQNVKRLKAVEIKPEGNTIVIGGDNGAGKSSVLDSIEFALGGDPDAAMPVRRGEKKAHVIVDLGEIVVKRSFTAEGGTHLVVTNADGQRQLSPQAILDKLTGALTFDPLEFSRQKPQQQADTLRALVGLDFTEHDKQREKIFDQRTAVNRETKQLEARFTAMPNHVDAPEAELSTDDLVAEQEAVAKQNLTNDKLRNEAKRLEGVVKFNNDAISSRNAAIEDLRKRLERAEKELHDLKSVAAIDEQSLVAAREAIKDLKDVNLGTFKPRFDEIALKNKKFRENAARKEVVKAFKEKTAEAEQLTQTLEEMDSKKRKAAMEAKYPIPGLVCGTHGITYNEIPLSQCSSAEQLKISVAIGIALNPKLKILLIRDGSLLDDNSLKQVAEMAKEAGAQVWIERVGVDEQTSVVIEDGSVKA